MGVGTFEGAARDAQASPVPRFPFFFRWVLAAPVSVWWLALGLATLQTLATVAIRNLDGTFDGLRYQGVPIWRSWVGLVELTYILWYAWLPLAVFYLVRGAERDLAALTALLPGSLNRAQLRADILCQSPRASWISFAAACLLTLVTLALVVLADDTVAFGEPWSSSWNWGLLRDFAANVCMAATLGWALLVGMRLSTLVGSQARISLLETHELAPLAHYGTRLAMFWLLVFSLGLPGMAIPAGQSFLVGIVLVTAIGSAPALIAAAAPLLGARRRLSELKAAELSRAREAIDAARREALASPASEAGTRASARLPGLLAWEARVMDVPVWLFDVSALRKLGLYLLIPLASWICAALVERALETALS